MKRLLPVLMGVALLLLSSTEGWSLPLCPGSPTSSGSTAGSWTDCFGTIIYSDGSKYVGDWKDRKWHGQGTQYNADGSVEQEGIFENNKFLYAKRLLPTTHRRTYTYPNGDKYVGEWKIGIRHGQGTLTLADGTVKEGIWEKNKFLYAKKLSPTVTAKKTPSKSSFPPCKDRKHNCFGTFTYGPKSYWPGSKYIGEYKDGRFHGQGTYTYANGDKYVGEWKSGYPNGQFTVTYPSGSKYVGEIRDWIKHGQGTAYNADGTVYQQGIWENGALKFAKKPSPTYNPEHLKRLKETNKCPECDLQGANLYRANLQGADLQRAILEDADLQGAQTFREPAFGIPSLPAPTFREPTLREQALWVPTFREPN